ncbi:hypothetical protein JYU34_012847 [Plutella xylostella]|uniref:Ionotropic receptor n=1 Tax=Plutella xylostella TaxID=51655 RepID=A0ABQ7QC97_PLUXY|nr:hypothetical protein JYU34_012847 [Plutella xylostella]
MNLTKSLGNLDKSILIKFYDEETLFTRLLPEHHVVFLVDASCNSTKYILDKANNNTNFRRPFHWFILNKDGGETIPTEIEALDLLPDAEVAIVNRIRNESYVMYLVYKISSKSVWRTEYYGEWSMYTGFHKATTLGTSTAMRRRDLERYVMPIAYVITNPDSINHFVDRGDGEIDTLSKVNYHTTNNILYFMNARRRFKITNTWGYEVNGTWTGLTGFMVRKEIEFGGTPLFLTAERISVIDYLACPTLTLSKFVFKQPNLSYGNNLFLLSFQTAVWYSSLLLVCVFFLVLFVVAFCEWNEKGADYLERQKDASILRAKMADVVILVLGAACQQGSSVELRGFSGRFVIFVLFLALMFLYTSYSANIVALLQSSSSQIQTLEDLLNSRMKCGCHDTVYNRHYFSTATEPVRKAIYQKKVAPAGSKPQFLSMEEGVKNMQKSSVTANSSAQYQSVSMPLALPSPTVHTEAPVPSAVAADPPVEQIVEEEGHVECERRISVPNTSGQLDPPLTPPRQADRPLTPTSPPRMCLRPRNKNGLYAFHMETGVGYKFVAKFFLESEKCGLKEIQYLQAFDPWSASRKHSPYREIFKLALLRIREHGLQSRENLLLYEKQPKCTSQNGNFVSVSMVDCYPVLLILCYGVFSAILLLAIEILYHRRTEMIKRLGFRGHSDSDFRFSQ